PTKGVIQCAIRVVAYDDSITISRSCQRRYRLASNNDLPIWLDCQGKCPVSSPRTGIVNIGAMDPIPAEGVIQSPVRGQTDHNDIVAREIINRRASHHDLSVAGLDCQSIGKRIPYGDTDLPISTEGAVQPAIGKVAMYNKIGQ